MIALQASARRLRRSTLAARRAAMTARLKARIDRAVKEGELSAGTDTAGLANFYATVIQGMSLQARDGATSKSLMAAVQAAMRAWPDSPKRAVAPQRDGKSGSTMRRRDAEKI